MLFFKGTYNILHWFIIWVSGLGFGSVYEFIMFWHFVCLYDFAMFQQISCASTNFLCFYEFFMFLKIMFE
jgi:hypothetical protein